MDSADVPAAIFELDGPPADEYTSGNEICCDQVTGLCKFCPSSPWLPVAELAAKVTKDCDAVAFTSIFLPKSHARMERQSFGNILTNERMRMFALAGETRSPHLSLCMVAIVNAPVAEHLSKRSYPGWTTITVDTNRGNMRRKSRIVKLLPHLFFPTASFIVFMDSKRKVKADPRTMIHDGLIMQSAVFNACWHPYAAREPLADRGQEWMFLEAGLVLQNEKTSEVEKFNAQMQRYRDSGVPVWMYIEGDYYAVNPQSLFSRKLLSAWYMEYERGGDRDQPALAYVLGSMEEPPIGPGRVFLSNPHGEFWWCRKTYQE